MLLPPRRWRKRAPSDRRRLGRWQAEAPQHPGGMLNVAGGIEIPPEDGVDDSEQRSGRCLQGHLRVLESEAPRLDSGLDVFPRSFPQSRLADSVGDLEAHQQPGKVWIASGQMHQATVSDGDLLGGIFDLRLSLLQNSPAAPSGHSPGGR